MIYFIIIGILTIIWDIIVLNKYPKKDYTVSNFIHKILDRYIIIAIFGGIIIGVYFPDDLVPMVVGALLSHFSNWRV